MTKIRLQKAISDYGYCSRRKAEELILNKQVKVNDEIIFNLGHKVSSDDIIKIDNQIINKTPKKIYIAFNKPRYVLTTTDDPKKRKTVMSFFSNIKERIYPIGRLDYDTSGLLLLTNDGEFSNTVLHPKYEINKKYLAITNKRLSPEDLNKLESGLKLKTGFVTSNSKITRNYYDNETKRSYIEIIIHEGKNHQVKNMFLAIHHDVIKLKRLEIGIVKLSSLKPGEYRNLTKKEIEFIHSIKKNSL